MLPSAYGSPLTFLTHHLPILQVVIPLMAAPLCVLAHRNAVVVWTITAFTGVLTVVTSLYLLARVLDQGAVSYFLGGWEPPWGIEYRVDTLSATMLLLVSGVGALVIFYGRASVTAEVHRDRHHLFWAAYLLCLAGLLGMVASADVFNVFVFLEISALSSYALIAFGRSRQALTGAFNYLLVGAVGATFYFIGIGLLYMATGTLNMADLASTLNAGSSNQATTAAIGFIVVGLSLKCALFPLHKWLPDAYGHAPGTVAAFLSATATKVSLYVLIRILFTVFGATPAVQPWTWPLLACSVLAMLTASATAVRQDNLAKLLAYSSAAQIGYMTLGVSMATAAGLSAAIVYMLNHAVIKGALFMAAGALNLRVGANHLDDLRGVGNKMPYTMAAFAIAGLALIGMPFTAGFSGKWQLMSAAFGHGWWPLVALMVLSSLLTAAYVWKVLETAYLQPAAAGLATVKEAPASMLIPLWVLIGLTIWLGFDAFTVDLADGAVRDLLTPQNSIIFSEGMAP